MDNCVPTTCYSSNNITLMLPLPILGVEYYFYNDTNKVKIIYFSLSEEKIFNKNNKFLI